MNVPIDKLVASTPKPDFDKEVLVPLRARQAEIALAEQAEQAEQARQELARQVEEQRRQLELTEVRAAQVPANCSAILAEAGITDITNAMYIISRESGCNAWAVNTTSGACGIAQALPCSKMNCAMGDGVCQVRWMNGYVVSRYGGWPQAVAFWVANHWY